ncbi:MAG: hypothetical protein ACR2JV_09700, partial [Gaiellales bacterium]
AEQRAEQEAQVQAAQQAEARAKQAFETQNLFAGMERPEDMGQFPTPYMQGDNQEFGTGLGDQTRAQWDIGTGQGQDTEYLERTIEGLKARHADMAAEFDAAPAKQRIEVGSNLAPKMQAIEQALETLNAQLAEAKKAAPAQVDELKRAKAELKRAEKSGSQAAIIAATVKLQQAQEAAEEARKPTLFESLLGTTEREGPDGKKAKWPALIPAQTTQAYEANVGLEMGQGREQADAFRAKMDAERAAMQRMHTPTGERNYAAEAAAEIRLKQQQAAMSRQTAMNTGFTDQGDLFLGAPSPVHPPLTEGATVTHAQATQTSSSVPAQYQLLGDLRQQEAQAQQAVLDAEDPRVHAAALKRLRDIQAQIASHAQGTTPGNAFVRSTTPAHPTVETLQKLIGTVEQHALAPETRQLLEQVRDIATPPPGTALPKETLQRLTRAADNIRAVLDNRDPHLDAQIANMETAREKLRLELSQAPRAPMSGTLSARSERNRGETAFQKTTRLENSIANLDARIKQAREQQLEVKARGNVGRVAPDKRVLLEQKLGAIERQLEGANQRPLLSKLQVQKDALEPRVGGYPELTAEQQATGRQWSPMEAVSNWLNDVANRVDTRQSEAQVRELLRRIEEARSEGLGHQPQYLEPRTRLQTPEEVRYGVTQPVHRLAGPGPGENFVPGRATRTGMSPGEREEGLSPPAVQQQELFRGTEHAAAHLEASPEALQKFLASDALHALRAEHGPVIETMQHLQARLAPLRERAKELEAKLATGKELDAVIALEAKEKTDRIASQTEREVQKRERNVVRLRSEIAHLTDMLEHALLSYRADFIAAGLALKRAQATSAHITTELKARLDAVLENHITADEESRLLRKQVDELEFAKTRLANALNFENVGDTRAMRMKTVVKATKLIRLLQEQIGARYLRMREYSRAAGFEDQLAPLTNAVFAEYLAQDAALQERISNYALQIDALKKHRSATKSALTKAYNAQGRHPQVTAVLATAHSDLAIAENLAKGIPELRENAQKEIARIDHAAGDAQRRDAIAKEIAKVDAQIVEENKKANPTERNETGDNARIDALREQKAALKEKLAAVPTSPKDDRLRTAKEKIDTQIAALTAKKRTAEEQERLISLQRQSNALAQRIGGISTQRETREVEELQRRIAEAEARRDKAIAQRDRLPATEYTPETRRLEKTAPNPEQAALEQQ